MATFVASGFVGSATACGLLLIGLSIFRESPLGVSLWLGLIAAVAVAVELVLLYLALSTHSWSYERQSSNRGLLRLSQRRPTVVRSTRFRALRLLNMALGVTGHVRAKPTPVIQFPSPTSSDLVGRVLNFLRTFIAGSRAREWPLLRAISITTIVDGSWCASRLPCILASKLLKQRNLESCATVTRYAALQHMTAPVPTYRDVDAQL